VAELAEALAAVLGEALLLLGLLVVHGLLLSVGEGGEVGEDGGEDGGVVGGVYDVTVEGRAEGVLEPVGGAGVVEDGVDGQRHGRLLHLLPLVANDGVDDEGVYGAEASGVAVGPATELGFLGGGEGAEEVRGHGLLLGGGELEGELGVGEEGGEVAIAGGAEENAAEVGVGGFPAVAVVAEEAVVGLGGHG
jgi:hypothetical protein